MIEILERLRPFSHLPGVSCLIPQTRFVVRAFPSKLQIYDLEDQQQNIIKEVHFEVSSPLQQFTLQQDLEGGFVKCFSEKYQYYILPSLEIRTSKLSLPLFPERICFGAHKKQEIEQIRKRLDIREIFPIWFRLGHNFEIKDPLNESRGAFSLVQECKNVILTKGPEFIADAFKRLYLGGFSSFFVPRLVDCDHQNLFEVTELSLSPIYLLTQGAKLIRSLFLEERPEGIAILPHLPPECFAGRMVHMNCSFGTLDLEWSKKEIKKIEIRANKTKELNLIFPKSIKRCRLRLSKGQKGIEISRDEWIKIEPDTTYLLDCFEK